jgi:hypothetical protein
MAIYIVSGNRRLKYLKVWRRKRLSARSSPFDSGGLRKVEKRRKNSITPDDGYTEEYRE